MAEKFYIIEGKVELIFDDQSVIAKAADTIAVPPNTWYAASFEKGGEMLTIFKNGKFYRYLQKIIKDV